MGIGPMHAVGKLLTPIGMQAAAFDVIESFAAQALGVGKGLGLDPERVNAHGGAIAPGHPAARPVRS